MNCLNGRFTVFHRNIFGFGSLPEQTVVVFITEQIEKQSRCIIIFFHQFLGLIQQDFPHFRQRIVGIAHPRAVQRHSITSERAVYHGIDTVFLINILYPPGRHTHMLPDGVYSHILQ